jgi:hypothetical protein
MTSDCMKPTTGIWITVALVAVLVAYPLTFGPACWFVARRGEDSGLFGQIYWPIGWCADHGPSAVLGVVRWYAMIGSPPGSRIALPSNSEMDSGLMISESSSSGRFIY